MRMFEGQGFKKNVFPNSENKEEAIRRFTSYVHYQRDYNKYTIVLENKNDVLLVDSHGNAKQVSMRWEFLSGPVLTEKSMKSEEIRAIRVRFNPPQLRNAIGNKYSMGGLLMYGISGLVIGSIIDSFSGPKSISVSVCFEFGKGQLFNDPSNINYYALKYDNVQLNDEVVKKILTEASICYSKLANHFPGTIEK